MGGTTLHSLLKLPINLSHKKELPELMGERKKALQDELKGMKLLVIDEKSMIGCYMLYMIHTRLCEIFEKNKSQPFAGISVIILGDFAQLAPVGGKSLFSTVDKDFSLYQTQGKMLFNEFIEKTIRFDVIMRQQGEDQQRFRECLDSLSNGTFQKTDWEYLKERDLFGPNFSPQKRKEFLDAATMICALIP